ncbi:hypothetical protein O181_051316, partial [Austropuccinia psidii MF-1]|nr:hypothetical protein [Austropuccinia psidii MF-1]
VETVIKDLLGWLFGHLASLSSFASHLVPAYLLEEFILIIFILYSLESSKRKKHTANLSEILHNNPKNYKQAMSNEDSDHWKQAISQELSNMDKHNIWSPISNEKEIKVLTTTWVFKKKTDENGNLTKYKARLCYLVGTKECSLKLEQNGIQHNSYNIIVFCNADWGGSKDRKSFSASIIYYAGSIGWQSHKQKVLALSSTEAEYNSMTKCCQDLLWVKQLIFEATKNHFLGILYSDNQSAISIASNHIYHHNTQHINFRLHFIQHSLDNKEISLKYLPTGDMLANSLTKSLSTNKIQNHLKSIFGYSPK